MELNRLFREINHAVVLSYDDKENLLARMIAICELNDGCQLDAQAALKVCRREMKRHHQPDEFYFVKPDGPGENAVFIIAGKFLANDVHF